MGSNQISHYISLYSEKIVIEKFFVKITFWANKLIYQDCQFNMHIS